MDKQLKILLVEDDEVDVMNVKRAFDKARIQNPLHVAKDGVEALELLKDDGFSKERLLLLLDINMPRMNGIELLREIRKNEKLHSLPVVVLTTSDDERDKFDAYDLNVAGYLLKPVTFPKFVEILDVLNRYWTLVEWP
ncbi:MAG: response regulator [Myxococcota bacterium]|nr:response regulator [Myxococcota bacterium]